MTGALWAAVAGVGFGLFQSLNRQALRGMDVYRSTFLQMLVAAGVLLAASVATDDLGRLWRAPTAALVYFALAGLVHFFVGWTLLNASQKRIGAARTSPLLGTSALFGAALAAVTLGEFPGMLAMAGIAIIVAGVYVVSLDKQVRAVAGDPLRPSLGEMWTASWAGLGTALSWAVSPVLLREGLRYLPSPLLGVTLGMVSSAAAYGVLLAVRRPEVPGWSAGREALAYKLVAGVLVGFSTWSRWYAIALVPVAVVLALALLSVPTVIVLAPLISGRHLERVTVSVAAGAALVTGGSLLLILRT